MTRRASGSRTSQLSSPSSPRSTRRGSRSSHPRFACRARRCAFPAAMPRSRVGNPWSAPAPPRRRSSCRPSSFGTTDDSRTSSVRWASCRTPGCDSASTSLLTTSVGSPPRLASIVSSNGSRRTGPWTPHRSGGRRWTRRCCWRNWRPTNPAPRACLARSGSGSRCSSATSPRARRGGRTATRPPSRRASRSTFPRSASCCRNVTSSFYQRAHHQVLFASRIVSHVTPESARDAMDAIRAAGSQPALIGTLERARVRRVSLLARASRRAADLSRIGAAGRATRSLRQFQGALFVLARAALRGSLPAARVRNGAGVSRGRSDLRRRGLPGTVGAVACRPSRWAGRSRGGALARPPASRRARIPSAA